MRTPSPTIALTAALLALPAAHAQAADAHQGVEAEHGEIVLLRDVHTRHAYRPAPPGVALIVDPSPQRELAQTLGAGELTDADFAALSTGGQSGAAEGPLVARMTRQALQGPLGAGQTSGGTRDAAGAAGTLNGLGGVGGMVGNATRGVGSQVTGALSQLPFGAPQGGNGP